MTQVLACFGLLLIAYALGLAIGRSGKNAPLWIDGPLLFILFVCIARACYGFWKLAL